MSPLWRKQIYISIKPGEVAALRIGKGLRPRVVEKTRIHCDAGGDTPWRNALTSLAALLEKPQWQQADAYIVLSNSFARFQLLPADAQVKNEEEQQAFARHTLSCVYGDISNNWEFRISKGLAGTDSLVCGVDSALLQAIDECCQRNRVRLRSVQPYLMAAYNQVRRELAQGAVWFAVAEQERVCAISLENGALRSIHSRSIAADDYLAALVTACEREQQLAGSGDRPEKILLYAPGVASSSLSPLAQSNFQMMKLTPRLGLDWETDAAYAMAASV